MAVLLTALTVAFNLVLSDRLYAEATSAVQARASAGLAGLDVTGNRIQLSDAPDERSIDPQVWIFQAGAPLEQPRGAPPANTSVAAALARVAPARRDVGATHTRLYAVPVAQAGRSVGAVVAGVSLRPYQQTQRTALVASIVLALAVFLAVAFSARWLISKALTPVARMTRQAAEWSERDLDRRFALGGPRDELTQLAATLDKLLDRLASSLRHEQRLSAELSHELRTPLASIAADAQFALRHTDVSEQGRASLENILASTGRMARTLDTLIAAARAQLDPHRGSSDAAGCAGAAIDAGRSSAIEDPHTSLHVASPGIRVAVEQDLVERILAPIIENARRHAVTSVELSVARAGADVSFTIVDDGAGVASDCLETIFEPGRRAGTAATAVATGAGLGLALARRLARSAAGDVYATASDRGGCFTVRLPAA